MKKPSQSENKFSKSSGEALERAGFSRRSFLKGGGALVIGFSMGGVFSATEALAQRRAAPGSPRPMSSTPGSPSAPTAT